MNTRHHKLVLKLSTILSGNLKYLEYCKIEVIMIWERSILTKGLTTVSNIRLSSLNHSH